MHAIPRMQMVNHFLSGASHFTQSTLTILLVVWSTNGNGSALASKASSKVNLLNGNTHRGICATVIIVSSFWKNRARCA